MIENHRSFQTSFGHQSAGHRIKNESEAKWTNISCKLLNTIYLFSTLSLSHPCFKYFPSSTGAWITRLQIQGRTVFFWLSWVIRLLLFSVWQKVSSLKQAAEKYSAMGRTSSRGSMTFFSIFYMCYNYNSILLIQIVHTKNSIVPKRVKIIWNESYLTAQIPNEILMYLFDPLLHLKVLFLREKE